MKKETVKPRKYQRKVTVTEETTGTRPVVQNRWKRLLISFLDTFVTGFLVALGTNLDALSMASDWQNMKVLLFSAVCGAGLAGVRAVVKAIRQAASKPTV